MAHRQRPITYRDRQQRVWSVSEVARVKLVAASIDGPNVVLVIRFEREGEERFARWIGGEDCTVRLRSIDYSPSQSALDQSSARRCRRHRSLTTAPVSAVRAVLTPRSRNTPVSSLRNREIIHE